MALPGHTKWPRIVDMSIDEAKCMRRSLELSAYSSIISALRSQGDLNQHKKTMLSQLRSMLGIPEERHRAEIRKCVNNERLATCAAHIVGELHDLEWKVEGRRAVPQPKIGNRFDEASALADSLADKRAKSNSGLELPAETGVKEILTAPPVPPAAKPKAVVMTSASLLASSTPSPIPHISNFENTSKPSILGPKSSGTRAVSPNTNVVVLPSGMSIHIKGGVNLDDDIDITGAKRRRMASNEAQVLTSRIKPPSVAYPRAPAPTPTRFPPYKTITTSQTPSSLSSQKVILVSSASGHTEHMIRTTNSNVPIVKTSQPTPSHMRTSIVLPASGPPNHRPELPHSKPPVQGPSIHTQQGVTVRQARNKAVLSSSTSGRLQTSAGKNTASITVSRPGLVIPVSSSVIQPSRPALSNRSNSTIHIKQEGAMKIIASTGNKLGKSQGNSPPSIVVVTCTANSVTSSIGRPRSTPSTSSSSSSPSVTGLPAPGKVISINTGKVLSQSNRTSVTQTTRYVNPKGRPPMTVNAVGTPIQLPMKGSGVADKSDGSSFSPVIITTNSNPPFARSSSLTAASTSSGNVVIVQTPTTQSRPTIRLGTESRSTEFRSSPRELADPPRGASVITVSSKAAPTLSTGELFPPPIDRNPALADVGPAANTNQSNSEVVVSSLSGTVISLPALHSGMERRTNSPMIDIFSSALAAAEINLYEFIDDDESPTGSRTTPLSWSDPTKQAQALWSSTTLASSGLFNTGELTLTTSAVISGQTTTVSISEPIYDQATTLLAQASALLTKSSQSSVPAILPKSEVSQPARLSAPLSVSTASRPAARSLPSPEKVQLSPDADIPEMVKYFDDSDASSTESIDPRILNLANNLIEPVTPIKDHFSQVGKSLPRSHTIKQPPDPVKKVLNLTGTHNKPYAVPSKELKVLKGPMLENSCKTPPVSSSQSRAVTTCSLVSPSQSRAVTTCSLVSPSQFRAVTTCSLVSPSQENLLQTSAGLSTSAIKVNTSTASNNSKDSILAIPIQFPTDHYTSDILSPTRSRTSAPSAPSAPGFSVIIPADIAQPPARHQERIPPLRTMMEPPPHWYTAHYTRPPIMCIPLKPLTVLMPDAAHASFNPAPDVLIMANSLMPPDLKTATPLSNTEPHQTTHQMIKEMISTLEPPNIGTVKLSAPDKGPGVSTQPVGTSGTVAEAVETSPTVTELPLVPLPSATSLVVGSIPERALLTCNELLTNADPKSVDKSNSESGDSSGPSSVNENSGPNSVNKDSAPNSVNKDSAPNSLGDTASILEAPDTMNGASNEGDRADQSDPSSHDDSLKENSNEKQVHPSQVSPEKNMRLVISLKDNVVKTNGFVSPSLSDEYSGSLDDSTSQDQFNYLKNNAENDDDTSDDDDAASERTSEDTLGAAPSAGSSVQRAAGRKRRRKSDPALSWRKQAQFLLKRVMSYRGPNRNKGEHGAAAWFLKPVSDDEAPGYSDVIDTPMDFTTVKRRLETYQYTSMDEFNTDMLQIYKNCCIYNPPEHNVRRDCELVFVFYRQEYERTTQRLEQALESVKKQKLALAATMPSQNS